MPIWTEAQKQEVLDRLAQANKALAGALSAIAARDKAQAADRILDAIASKHHAATRFPPIRVRNNVDIPAGEVFRAWENKELFAGLAFAASADPAGDHSTLINQLQSIISQVLDMVMLPWSNPACAEHLRKLERHLRNLKSYLASSMGQDTEAKRRLWWSAFNGIRVEQAAFINCVYRDTTRSMGDVFLGLIEVDSRLAAALGSLAEWERTGDDTRYQRSIEIEVRTAKETKEELEELIREFGQ